MNKSSEKEFGKESVHFHAADKFTSELKTHIYYFLFTQGLKSWQLSWLDLS